MAATNPMATLIHNYQATLGTDFPLDVTTVVYLLDDSGRSTPLPPDAPPSAQSISSVRKQIRAQQKHRIFPTVEYAARVSHFDPRSEYRDFRGFFVLFWIGLAIMVITTMLRNIKDTGYPLRHQMWDLLTTKTWELAISDAVMVGSTGLSVALHKKFRTSKGWLRWENAGMPIQSAFQVAWLALWIKYAVLAFTVILHLLTGIVGLLFYIGHGQPKFFSLYTRSSF